MYSNSEVLTFVSPTENKILSSAYINTFAEKKVKQNKSRAFCISIDFKQIYSFLSYFNTDSKKTLFI